MNDQVERIVRALEGIRRNVRHEERCRNRSIAQWKVDGCICDAAVEAQAAAVLEAIQHATSSEYPGKGKFGAFAAGVEAGVAALERLAGSLPDKEEIPNA